MAPINGGFELVPPIPSYDEAVAEDSRPAFEAEPPSPSIAIGGRSDDAERHLLLPTRSRRELVSESPGGFIRTPRSGRYRPPTVETDDEESLWGSEDDDVVHMRREMQQLEVVDPVDGTGRYRSSFFGKGFSISLPKWKWSWRWRLPRLRIRLPGSPEPDSTGESLGRRWEWPGLNAAVAFLVLGRLLAVLLVLGFLYLLFVSDVFSNMSRRLGSQTFDPENVRIHIQGSVEPQRLRDHVRHFTRYAHLAGTEGDFALAEDVKNLFVEYGLEQVTVDEYYVYLNYPKAGGRAVEILGADGKPTWSARLEEDGGGAETRGHETLAFHGHSKSGDVRGPLIYAHFGSREDFKVLHDSGIETKGAIALVRYYGSQGDRALKVKAAELAGFAGCIIYSDPTEDGFVRGGVAPNGRYMPADGVQRGAVSLMSWVCGDVLTPGWESKKGLPRLSPTESPGLVQIPSMPLSWRDAQVLLQNLRGAGQRVPRGWEGGVPDVGEWWTGNQSSPVVRLRNEQDEVEQQPIWNVYGKIVGVEQAAQSIIIGNHRDAWTSGATDPHSGTAVLLEMVRIFGDLLARGWRPRRSIEFKSWDGEEYNLIGSTEFVEKNMESLQANALAYINLDTAVAGDSFRAAGAPVFRKLLLQILKRVSDPNANATLRELWDRRHGELEGLGAGSDYVAFQDMAGTSSLDLHFGGPPFPYHSAYDTFDWMERVGDPGFVYHTLLGQVLGLLIIELADRPIMPFDLTAYARSLKGWVADVAAWASTKAKAVHGAGANLDLGVLRQAADAVAAAVVEFEKWEDVWQNSVLAANGWEPTGLGSQREEYNTRMGSFDSDLLDLELGGGIPNRTQFKHVVFGPQLWSGYEEAFFPAIRDVVEAGDWALANQTVEKVARILRKAAAKLIE